MTKHKYTVVDDGGRAIRQVAERRLTEGTAYAHISIDKTPDGIGIDRLESRFFDNGDEESAKEFARAFLGDNFDSFDCDFGEPCEERDSFEEPDEGPKGEIERDDGGEADEDDDISDEEFAEQLSKRLASKKQLKESPKHTLNEDPN